MTTTSDRPPWRATLRAILSTRMLMALAMGFSSGLPLLLTGSLLQAWLKEAKVDLGTIGLFALVGVPYSVKFLWAPLLDRFTLSATLGRRRGWLLLTQILLVLAIIGLGLTQPAVNPWQVALAALILAFFSASQDIVIDAYRRESLADDEQGLGASLYVNGYRIAMWVVSGLGFILADHLPFSTVYFIMAAFMAPGVAATLFAAEPPAAGKPTTLMDAVIQPFIDYFSRPDALVILAFILLYKIGDTMAGSMTTPFYLETGFSKTEIGVIVKTFGFWMTLLGGLLGGVLMLRLGVYRSLWLFGILQAVSTLGFAILDHIGPRLTALAAVIAFENLSAGMGTSVLVGFMASLTNQKFTATQYALLTSFMALPRTVINTVTGYLAQALGWSGFFVLCVVIALPGLLLLLRFRQWLTPAPSAEEQEVLASTSA
ncbi:MAG: AmpG family muropeptide MFS transporter [Gammaproteobacteria bacterium]